MLLDTLLALCQREAADGARHAADDAMSLLRCMFEAADESQKRELRAMIGDVRRQQREGEIDGVTSTLALRARVMQINLLPELIQMQCSMMGAWGAATPRGYCTAGRPIVLRHGR